MHSFRLLICWASLFVASWMGVLAENMDYKGLCVKCVDENAFPDCQTNATAAHLNLTIYCQKYKKHYCTLGIVNGSDADVETPDYICRLRQASLNLEKLESDGDDFKIISIMEEPVKPLPLLLQSTTESVKPTTDGGNIQILSITQEAIEPSKPEVSHMAIVANPDAMAALEDGTDVEVAPPEADVETIPEVEEPAKEEVAEAPEPPPEVPQPPAEVPQPPADAPQPPAEVPEPPAVEPEASKDEAAEPASTDAETESEPDKNEAPAAEPEVAATATEANKDAEAPSNTNSMDYQGDEAKPDAEVEAEVVAPPTPAGDTNTGPVKVPNNPPSGGNPPVVPPMKCYACTSLSYANCTQRPDTEIDCRPVEEGKNIKNGCYTLFKGTQLQRGCLVDLTDAEHQNCLEATSTTCRMCETSSCNNASWPQCYTCNSSREPLCAWWPEEAAKQVQRAICPTHSARCVSRVDAASVTLRYCAASTVTCDASGNETCTTCAGSFCNGGIFPAARRRCLQCAGDAACADAQTAPLPCLLYRHDERCFFYANATNQMIRGCASAATEFEDCRLAASKCVQCDTSDGCNDAPLMKVPQLKCRRCNSLQTPSEYETCVWAQATSALTSCIKKFPYYMQETCLTIYNPDMKWAIRECSLDFGACEPMDQLCLSCNTDGCNGDNMKWQYCLQCDSATEPSCDNDASSIKLQKCTASVQPYELRGCYIRFSAETNTTSRGCISDLAAEGMQYCKENVKHCTLCYEQGCNHRSPSLASFVARMDMGMIVGMLLTVMIANYV